MYIIVHYIYLCTFLCANLIFYFWTCYEIYFKFYKYNFKIIKRFFKEFEVKRRKFLLWLLYAFYPFLTLLPGVLSNVLILCLMHPSFRDTVRFRKRIRVFARLFIVRGINGKRGMIFTHALHHRRYTRSYVIYFHFQNLLLILFHTGNFL